MASNILLIFLILGESNLGLFLQLVGVQTFFYAFLGGIVNSLHVITLDLKSIISRSKILASFNSSFLTLPNLFSI